MRARRPAVIAVASGKGGTGKTTVTAHLALASARARATSLVDLDVEAPDALGYFGSAEALEAPQPVSVSVPRVREAGCTGCRLCARSCRFGAIVALGTAITVNDQICKGCGRCVALCPAKVLAEADTEVGSTRRYRSGGLELLEGRMKVGDIRSTTVIEAAKRRAGEVRTELEIRDCPPGVSCPATHAIEGADYVVLVAEPTAFSLHDLGAAVELVRGRGIPAGLLINKDGFGGADVEAFCRKRSLPIIGRVAFDRERAASGAAGRLWEGDRQFMREMELVLATAMAGARVLEGGAA